MTSSFQKIKKLGALFALLFILVSAISPVVSYAAIVDVSKNEPANYTLLEPLPCVEGNGSGCKTGTQVTTVDFKNYVQYMFNLVIALARREMVAKGPIPKILKLLPVIKPAYELYPKYLSEKGLQQYFIG